MELNDIKSAWKSLDEQLKKQEAIKESILRELIQSKAKRSLSRLINYEWFSLFAVILVSPLTPYILFVLRPQFSIFSTVIVLVLGTYIFSVIGTQIWKIKTIGAIDFSNSIGDNMKLLNKFNLFIKKEKSFTVVMFTLLVIFFFSRIYLDEIYLSGQMRFIYFFIIGLGVLFSVWLYKNLYNKHVDSIKKSLEELEELKEEA